MTGHTITRRALLLSAAATAAGGRAMGETRYRGYEGPAYAVEVQDGAFELRLYAPQIVAEVTVRGDRRAALSRGFRVLAGYIFGGNDGAAKVAMTAPVAQEPARIAMTAPVAQQAAQHAAGDAWVVRFTMPSDLTLATLPRPRDPAVRLVELPGDRQAVLRFSGLAGAGTWAAREAELAAWVATRGLTPAGALRHYWYDDPFTLPWRRRNEVAQPVA
jgi:hypothetical protein